MVTGCVVGFAGRRAAERANDSVASAKHIICSPEDGATKSNAAKLSAAGSSATDDGARCPPASTPVSDNADRSDTKSGSISTSDLLRVGAKPRFVAPPPPVRRTNDDAPPAPPRSALQSAMLNASGGAAPAAPQAKSTENVDSPSDDNSGLPDTPGVGALQSVVHPLLPAARACIRDQSEASHANIVFGSNGRVSSVVINGAAAGTPAESCVRAAFMRATVAPFRRPKYVVGVAVRP